MADRISPNELYDMANICSQAYRGRPQVPGWTPVSGAELKLAEAVLDAFPYVNRACVLWHRRRLNARPSAAAIAFRTNLSTITSRHRPDVRRSVADLVAKAERIADAAERWLRTHPAERLFVTGHHVGGLIAYEIAGRFATETRPVTAVVFGCRHAAPSAAHTTVVEVQHEGVVPIDDADAIEISRQDDYLAAIRRGYEAGSLAAMLGEPADHMLITLGDPSKPRKSA